jgi:REP element-mobilizing transposase RayT
MRQNMTQPAMVLNAKQRAITKQAIKEVCGHRGYHLAAVRVLTNHFHVVVSAHSKPEPITDAFKSYSTRKLRETGLIGNHARPWARGRSRSYLWKAKHVARAIEYVLYGQGDLPEFED